MTRFILNFSVVLIGLVSFILIEKYDQNNYREQVFNGEYFGSVDTVYLDPKSRMQPKALLDNSLSVFIESEVSGRVGKGDTLFKIKGSFKHYLIHKGDTTIYYAHNGDEVLK